MDLSGDHALADLVPVQELGFHGAVGVEGFRLLMADAAPASAPPETGTSLRWPREPILPEPPSLWQCPAMAMGTELQRAPSMVMAVPAAAIVRPTQSGLTFQFVLMLLRWTRLFGQNQGGVK